LKIAKEQKLDIEKALFDNNARVAGDATTARELAGTETWFTSTIQNRGTGGAHAAGTGVDARTDGTQTVFNQTKFDAIMQNCWEKGGKPDSVYLSAYLMNLALAFTGNNNQRSTVQAGDSKVVKSLDVYVTPWGTIEFIPSRENRGRTVHVMQDDMWAVAVLRGTNNVELAKTGDSTKRQVLTELTLVAKNEKSSGLGVDFSTS